MHRPMAKKEHCQSSSEGPFLPGLRKGHFFPSKLSAVTEGQLYPFPSQAPVLQIGLRLPVPLP